MTALPPVVLTDTTDVYEIAQLEVDHVEYLEDKDHQWTIDDVSSRALGHLFVTDTDSIADFKETDAAFWMRFRLKDESGNRRWLIDSRRYRTFVLRRIFDYGPWVPIAKLGTRYSSMQLYIPWSGAPPDTVANAYWSVVDPPGAGRYLLKTAPVDAPFHARDLQYRGFTFFLPDSTDWKRPFYMRFNHENAMSKRVRVISLEHLHEDHRGEQTGMGVYFGAIIALFCYNLFLYARLRDQSYLYYVLYIASASLFIASYQGVGFEFLWPSFPEWNRDSLYIFNGLTILFAALFTRSFLDTKVHAPRQDRQLLWLVAIALLDCAVSLWYSVDLADRLSYGISIGLIPLCLTAGRAALRGGFRPARYYLMAWSVLLASVFLFMLHATSLFRPWAYAYSSIDILRVGIFCEAVLLSLGLADRIQLLRQRASEHQAAAEQARLQAQAAEGELETARRLQQGLMPQSAPVVPGLEIAGRCLPATHVGGDFFQYFERHGRLAICLADATGHAMDAAIPAVMFSGVLESEITHSDDLGTLYTNLNRNLHRKLDRRTFVCLAMGELRRGPVADAGSGQRAWMMQLANSGCPFAVHYQADKEDVVEHEVIAYPLGVRPEASFPVLDVDLRPGDRLVLYSDGVVEAEGPDGVFGFDRLVAAVRGGCLDGLSAEAMIDRLLDVVKDFSGSATQEDDQTIVVVRVEQAAGS